MQYTEQTRKDIKRECKAHTLEHLGRCIGINFLYAVPVLLLSLIMLIGIYGPLIGYIMRGGMVTSASIEAFLLGYSSHIFNTMAIYALLMLLICGPLTFGMMKFYIGMRRGQEPGAGILFKPFSSLRTFWNGIKMSFCLGFRSFLWSILPMIVWIAAMFVMVIVSVASGYSQLSAANYTLLYVLLFILIFPVIIKIMTYQAGWIVINDNETYGAWAATRDASSVFRGHYGKMVLFALSFLPWIILQYIAIYGIVVLGAFSQSVVVFILMLIASVCISILFGAFISTYINTSFIGLYEFFVTAQHEQYNAYASQQQNTVPQQVYPPAQSPAEQQPYDSSNDGGTTPPSAE